MDTAELCIHAPRLIRSPALLNCLTSSLSVGALRHAWQPPKELRRPKQVANRPAGALKLGVSPSHVLLTDRLLVSRHPARLPKPARSHLAVLADELCAPASVYAPEQVFLSTNKDLALSVADKLQVWGHTCVPPRGSVLSVKNRARGPLHVMMASLRHERTPISQGNAPDFNPLPRPKGKRHRPHREQAPSLPDCGHLARERQAARARCLAHGRRAGAPPRLPSRS